MNWDLAQRIPETVLGDFWLVPGAGSLCLVDQGSLGNPAVGTACAPTAIALAQGVASVTITPGGAGTPARLIVGVVPDGAREVTVHSGAAAVTAPVSGTTFVVQDRTAAPADRFEWRR